VPQGSVPLGCMMRTTAGAVPEAAQAGIESGLCAEGYLLPCLCRPLNDINLEEALLIGDCDLDEMVRARQNFGSIRDVNPHDFGLDAIPCIDP
jgi:hypothetical protein